MKREICRAPECICIHNLQRLVDMGLVNHNGEILSAITPIISIDNRSFRYGDGLFESMRVVDGKVVMLDRHLERLTTGMRILKLSPSPDYSLKFWSKVILELCQENNCVDKGRVRLTIYRKSGGFYAPTDSNVGFLIEAEKNDTIFSDESAKGLHIGVFEEIKKPINELGMIKTANSLIYVMAGVSKDEQKMDDMIILNDKGRVAEAISSNVFIVKDRVLKTPALSEGCVAGVTRDWLLKKAENKGMEVQETEVSPQDVLDAEEVFLTNAIQGLRKVARLGDSTYSDKEFQVLRFLKPEAD